MFRTEMEYGSLEESVIQILDFDKWKREGGVRSLSVNLYSLCSEPNPQIHH